jgi:uncharacterized repeat protein (TIGR01451 family)
MRNGYAVLFRKVVTFPKALVIAVFGLFLLSSQIVYAQCDITIDGVDVNCNFSNATNSFSASVDISWDNAPNATLEVSLGGQTLSYTTSSASGTTTITGFDLTTPGYGYAVMATVVGAAACQDFSTADAIACTPACPDSPDAIGGFLWKDDNANGMFDGELGQPNVKIEAYDCEGGMVGTAYSNADGQWSITGLNPGEKYRVELSAQQIPGIDASFSSIQNGSNVQFADAGDCAINAAFMSSLNTEVCENPSNVGSAPCLENFNTLDWSNFANGSNPFPFPPYGQTVNSDVVYWSRSTDDATPYTHKVFHTVLGGSPAYYYLEMDADNTSDTDSKGVGAVFSFDRPVARLQFELLDIDITGDAVDRISVEGFLGGMPVELSMDDIQAGIFVNVLAPNLYEGTTSVDDISNTGNVYIEFPSPVDQVSITFSPNGSMASNPGVQAVGIGNLNWCSNYVAVDPQCVRFFDWMNFQDNDANPTPYSINGMDIEVSTDDPAGIANNAAFQVDNDATPMGGQRGYWPLAMDANAAGQYVETTIDFEWPVEQLSFSILDIDSDMDTGAGFTYKDKVSVYGYINGVEVPLTMSDISAGSSAMGGSVDIIDPNSYEAQNKVVNNTSQDGNIYVSFSDRVDQVVVRLEAGSGVDNPMAQFIGLSDLSFCICVPGKLQIGNRVWEDKVKNGVQDACEQGIEDLLISLYDAQGALLAYTYSDADGHYAFSKSDATNENWIAEGQVMPNTTYYIVFGNDNENPDNTFIIGNNKPLSATSFQTGQGNSPFMNDSDLPGVVSDNMPGVIPDGLPYITYTTADGGTVNNTLDAGFEQAYFDIALTKTLDTALTAPPFIPGEQVAYLIKVYNEGMMNAESLTLMDYIPDGLILQGNDWTQTGNQAIKIITNLAAGDSLEFSIIFNISPNYTGTTITNRAEIGRADNAINIDDIDSDPDYNPDNDDPGEDDFDQVMIELSPALVFDLSLEKSVNGNGPFQPGADVSFTIEIENEGIMAATNVQINDYIPAGLILNDPNWTANNGVATLNTPIASIGTGSTETVTINFTIDQNFAGASIINEAEIRSFMNFPWTDDQDSSPDNDISSEDDQDEALVSIVAAPFDLALEKTVASPGPYSPGSLVTYDITVTNQGGSMAQDIILYDYIPNGLIYSGTTWEVQNDIARYEYINSLAPGASSTVQVSFIVDPNFQGTSITNRAEIYAVANNPTDTDSTPGNASTQEDDDDIATIAVQQQVQVFDLALNKEIDISSTPGPFGPGDFISFALTVTNEGNVAATNVQIADYVPPGLMLADFNWVPFGNVAILGTPIPTIQPGASETVTIDFFIDDGFIIGQIENLAEIYSAFNSLGMDDLDSYPGNGINNGEDDEGVAYVQVQGTPTRFDLSLEKSVNTSVTPGPFYTGGTVTFTISVTNEGTLTANSVQIGDNLPQGLTLNDADWIPVQGGAILGIPMTSLEPGETESVDITFTIDDNFVGTSIMNYAEIVSATNPMSMPDEDSTPNNGVLAEDDIDNAQLSIQQNFDLAFSKTVASSGPFEPGDQITYNLTIYNQGTLAATNIGVYDYYPTQYMVLSDPDWQPVTGNILRLSTPIANLAPGASTVVPITFTIKSQTPCGTVLTNCGEIAYASNAAGLNDSDSVPANGSHDEDDDDAIDVTVSCTQAFDLALEKSLNTSLTPGPFTPGSTVSFTIDVTNQGDITAQNIQLADYIPSGLILIDPDWSAVGSVAALNNPIPALAPGMSTSVEVSFAISPSFSGTSLVNFAEITGAYNILGLNDVDSTPGNGSAGPSEDDYDNAIISVTQQVFDLALSKSLNTNVTPGPFLPGDEVTFNINIVNQGLVTAQNIQLREYIPLGLTLNDPNWNAVGSIAELVLPIGSLAPGASTSVNVTFTISPSFSGTSLTNFAEIGYAFNAPGLDDNDSTPGNGSAGSNEDDYDGATISILQSNFDLALQKSLLSSGPFAPGDAVTFRLTLTNQGSIAASSVQLRDYIPLGLILADANWTANGTTATYNTPITNLQPGASVNVDITFTISPSFTGTTITNFAEIGSATNTAGLADDDSTPGNGSAGAGEDDFDSAALTVAQQQFDLALTKSLNTGITPGPFTPGSTVTFTLTVTNQGTLTAQNVQLRDYIPLGLVLADNNWTANGTTAELNTPIATLVPGAVVSRNITFTISPSFTGGTITNFGEVGAASNSIGAGDVDSTPGNGSAGASEDDFDSAAISVSVAQSFDLALSKSLNTSATPGPFQPGDLVTYTITVTNQGSVTAQNISVVDYLPTGMLLADAAWGGFGSTAVLNSPINSLPPGASTSVDITLVIDPLFSGTSITNYAEIKSASNTSGLNDIDSTPNNGFAGPTEDDLDFAVINVTNQEFDLALNKNISASTPGPYVPNAMVTYELVIINQGDVTANNIQLRDFIPLGLVLVDSDWTQVGGVATYNNAIPSISAGGFFTVSIDFVIDPNFQGTSIVNFGEILNATNTLGLDDSDSTPGNGSLGSNEDDYDSAVLAISTEVDPGFDLALTKTVNTIATPGPYAPGGTVTYSITITNQGDFDAFNIEVTDYIPAGLILADANWALSGTTATRLIPGPVAASGGSTTINVSFLIDPTYTGAAITNYAEISFADDDNVFSNTPPTDVDSQYDAINFNDGGGQPNSPADNAINGNGMGAPGSGVAALDEDDHDPAFISLDNCAGLNAGTNGFLEICLTCNPTSVFVDLFGALGGNPSPGGVWTDNSGSGVNLMDPTNVDITNLSPGIYTYTYTVGGQGTCPPSSAIVTLEIENITTYACNDQVNLVFGIDNCEREVTPDMILEGSDDCMGSFVVVLYDQFGQNIGNTVNGAQVGQLIFAEVYDPFCGLLCTGTVLVLDVTPPTLICPTQTVDLICSDVDSVLNNPASLPITGEPTVFDNCADFVNVTFVDQLQNTPDCADQQISRTFTATDPAGNSTSCTQIITIRLATASDIIAPPGDVALECDDVFPLDANGNPHPSVTGFPLVDGYFGDYPIDQTVCNVGASYQDATPIMVCAGTVKIPRTWTIVNWCEPAPNNIFTLQQLIKVGDTTPPTVTCPNFDINGDGTLDPLTFSTSPFDCSATFSAPLPQVSDNCSGWEVFTDIMTEQINPIFNQFGILIGFDTVDVVVASIAPDDPTRVVSGIPVGCHFFRYTVVDDCDNTTVVDCDFCVIDDIEPTAVCDDDLNISLGGNGFARVFAVDIDEGSNDNCGIDTLLVRRLVVVDPVTCDPVTPYFTDWLPYVDFTCCDVNMMVTIELQAIDIYGNSNICWLDVLIEDKINPFCVAPQNMNVSCADLPPNFDPLDTLQLQSLFGEATAQDDCGVATVFELAPIANLDICGFGTIIRRFGAIDEAGNQSTNFCQQIITITEEFNYVIKFPKDATSDCGIPDVDTIFTNTFGCDNLSISVTDEIFTPLPGSNSPECYKVFRTYRVLNHCEFDGLSDAIVIGRDEDCDGEPGDEDVWVVRLPNGAFVDRDNNPFNNIPAFGTKGLSCDGSTNPTGYWRTTPSVGLWEYTQIIKVIDDTAPQVSFTPPAPFCSIDEISCNGTVQYPFFVTENCSPDGLTVQVFLDANADGTIDFDLTGTPNVTGTYPNYNITGEYPIGMHNFIVQVEDGCGGNTDSATLPFEVVDCAAPSFTCLNGVVFQMSPLPPNTDIDGDGIFDVAAAGIWANDFTINASDCSDDTIAYSVNLVGEPPVFGQTSLYFTCEDTGTIAIEVYVWDSAFNPYSVQPDGTIGGPNYDFCSTFVLIQDNSDACGPAPGPMMAGVIAREDDSNVEGVEVSLSGQMNMMMMTSINGTYEFEDLDQGYDYSITPYLNTDHRNGISTFDMLLIQQHLLGVTYLNSPYKMIAADVNHTNSITTLDLIQIQRIILGIDLEFPNNTSWRFVDASYTFPVPTNPWFNIFPEAVNVNDLNTDILFNNFVAIKTGDVNYTATTTSLDEVEDRNFDGLFTIEIPDVKLKAGELVAIPFKAEDIAQIDGYQFTLDFDKDVLELEEVEYGIADEASLGLHALEEGYITTSWYGNDEEVLDQADDKVLFTLIFRAKQDKDVRELLWVSSRYTMAEAYSSYGTVLDVALAVENAEQDENGKTFALYQNLPNPFNALTRIGFHLPEAGEASLSIYSLDGKLLKRYNGVYDAGYQEINVNRSDVPASGVLYYRLEMGEYTATKKMIVIE